MSILHKEKKLGAFLLQLSPAFSPRKHELGELEPLIRLLRDFPVGDRVSESQLGGGRSADIDDRVFAAT